MDAAEDSFRFVGLDGSFCVHAGLEIPETGFLCEDLQNRSDHGLQLGGARTTDRKDTSLTHGLRIVANQTACCRRAQLSEGRRNQLGDILLIAFLCGRQFTKDTTSSIRNERGIHRKELDTRTVGGGVGHTLAADDTDTSRIENRLGDSLDLANTRGTDRDSDASVCQRVIVGVTARMRVVKRSTTTEATSVWKGNIVIKERRTIDVITTEHKTRLCLDTNTMTSKGTNDLLDLVGTTINGAKTL